MKKTDIYTIYGRKNVLIFIYNFSKIKITQSTVWLTAIHSGLLLTVLYQTRLFSNSTVLIQDLDEILIDFTSLVKVF